MDCYKYSGEITKNGLINGMITGVAAAAVLSVPYAYATAYIPLVYANLLAVGAYAFAVGWVSAKVARAGGLQSPAMYIVIGVISGIVAEYLSWVGWIFVLSKHSELLFNPLDLIATAGKILPVGTWGLRSGGNISGIPLLCVWILEAAAIIGIATYFAYQGLVSHICCPHCKKWFDAPAKVLHFNMPDNPGQVVESLKNLDFKPLLALEKVDPATVRQYLAVEIYFCPSCSKFGCFNVSSVVVTIKKDKNEIATTVLLNRLLLPMERLQELLPQTPAAV